MHDRIIARIGLCAAAAVFAASLGVLIFQNVRTESAAAHSSAPAQVQPVSVIIHSQSGT